FTAPLQQCQSSGVTVVASAAGKLDAWIDFDHNGTFDAGEKIFASTALTAGSNALTFAVPCGAVGGQTYARFRLSSAGGLGPAGIASDGEVEDYAIAVIANQPQLGLAKRLVSATADATNHSLYHLTFAFDVVNSGNADLTALQVTDNLSTTFAGAISATVQSVQATGTLVANAGYDGAADTHLLGAGSTLATGASESITLNVDLVVDAVRSFNNTATATGTGPGNTPVSDVSQDGSDPDPDHDGNPTNNGDPTPVVLPAQTAEIGLSKALVSVVPAGANNHLTFVFTVTNPGNTDLSNVAVTDDLQTAFTGALSFHVTNVSATGTLVANAAFDGAADKNLLAGTSTLAAGATATITLKVDLATTNVRNFVNTATTTAVTTVGGHPVSDTSQNGGDPDPDHDGNPANNGDPTPIAIPASAPVLPAPAMGPFAALVMGVLLMLFGAQRARRQRR
ncbi:MAG TPA: GEVED domain-containing protein, partial [Rudaea sp.]